MKRPIYLMAVLIVAAFLAAIDFTPAQAIMTEADPQVHANSSLIYVHCRRVYHCYWTMRGDVKIRHCHVCG
jgi:hypothetical protein